MRHITGWGLHVANCDICGRKMQANTKWGVCIFTPECRKEFDLRRRTPEGGWEYCPTCGGKLSRNNNVGVCRRTLDCARDRDLRKHFGITLEQYKQMLSRQDDKCMICRKPCATGRRLAVDHDHVTGRIRDLLCTKCNTALGAADDSIERLGQMILYLQKWK